MKRIITDEMTKRAARAHYVAMYPEWVGAGDAWDDMGGSEPTGERADHEIAMRAALEAAAPLIAAQALEVARGPYRCCPHCADDLIHDVERDDHTVPCQLCQNDEISRAVAQALRETANDDELWRLTEGEQRLLDANTPYYEGVAYGFRIARSLLKDHAARITNRTKERTMADYETSADHHDHRPGEVRCCETMEVDR